MKSTVLPVSLLALIALVTFLSASLVVSPVSACSLASPVAPWLQFVLDHNLATLTPDCRLVWQTGVVTDLNGNVISSPTNLFFQQFGVVFFAVGVALTLFGVYLVFRAKRFSALKSPVPATA